MNLTWDADATESCYNKKELLEMYFCLICRDRIISSVHGENQFPVMSPEGKSSLFTESYN